MLKTASEDDIKRGKVTDVYFDRTRIILEKRGVHKRVVAEFSARQLPDEDSWAVFCGLADVLDLLGGIPVDVEALPEGTLFRPGTPVLSISGDYLDFGIYETSILGLICQASGIATRAARVTSAAGGRPVLAFGTRRMHPALAAVLDRNAYAGGCAGISTVFSGDVLGILPSGTIPHALVLLFGDTLKATQAFHEIIDRKVPRIALIDTFQDEKFEAIRIAEKLGRELYGIRFDTPSSRRGDFVEILREVRWELDIRGHRDVKIFVSGGLTDESVRELNAVADAYGVGNFISNAPVIDFSMDIVEIDGQPIAKRGKQSGHKVVVRGEHPPRNSIRLAALAGKRDDLLTRQYIYKGELVAQSPAIGKLQKYVLSQLEKLPE